MMLNLFSSRYSADVKKANWRYYEPRTEHGSSLSACAYAMVATEIGELDAAYDYFLKTAKIDLEAKYKLYVGTTFIGGSHPAANGGAWMTAVFGFGGLRADEHHVRIAPRLPRKWRSLTFGLDYAGNGFRIRITPNSVTIEPARTNRRSCAFLVGDKPVVAEAGTSVTVEYSPPRQHSRIP
jgi:kojibiose phosphorylase